MLSNDYGIECMTDPDAIDHLAGVIQEKQEYIRKLEDALCMAICIIQNDAGIASMQGLTQTHETRTGWANELIAESGIDFDVVLGRRDDGKEGNDDTQRD